MIKSQSIFALPFFFFCHMKPLPSRRVLCTPYNHAPFHFMQSHMRKVYVWLAVTCHLHFWQDDRYLLRATAVTRGWNGYRNRSQHRKLTLEKKNLPPLPQGFEPATFQSRVRCSNHWAIPAPWSLSYPRSRINNHGCIPKVTKWWNYKDILESARTRYLLEHNAYHNGNVADIGYRSPVVEDTYPSEWRPTTASPSIKSWFCLPWLTISKQCCLQCNGVSILTWLKVLKREPLIALGFLQKGALVSAIAQRMALQVTSSSPSLSPSSVLKFTWLQSWWYPE